MESACRVVDNSMLTNAQIMDGSPSRGMLCHSITSLRLLSVDELLSIERVAMYTNRCAGETIPIRLFLGGFDLTPTFREVNKKYSTRYYLSLVLIDEGKLLMHCAISVP